MKRIAQFAAVLAIALFVAQPALAGSICIFGQSATCVTGCPMAMDNMGPDCPMASGMVASGCSMDCCPGAAMQASEPLAAANKWRTAVQTLALADASEISAANPVAVGPISVKFRGVSPPRYILNQVFRI